MNILSLKPGHDGSAAFVADGKLIYLLEAEKNSFPRYTSVTTELFMEAMEIAPGFPDVIAVGGWHKPCSVPLTEIGAGYFGIYPGRTWNGRVFGQAVTVFSSSHERSHLFMAAAMHPGAPLKECAILVWEGRIGALYHWREYGTSIRRIDVLSQPGARWSALFALAEPTFPPQGRDPNLDYAGKLMALTAYDLDHQITQEQQDTVDRLLCESSFYPFNKLAYRGTSLYDCGIPSPEVSAAARYLSDRLFNMFRERAEMELPGGLPLLISGGCGLNCDWNRRWSEQVQFTEVFIPPCANDSGSAVGTAADALAHLGGPCRLEWSVYAGSEFQRDVLPDPSEWNRAPADPVQIAQKLGSGALIAWVQGRCEIGPRALGHRSLLASPLFVESREVLNRIKRREGYRPIAPCCRVEELHEWFEPPIDDPFMLFFSRVTTDALPAITHADGTARVQVVRADEVPDLHRLLGEVRRQTGYGVLCNTSLNFKGLGFINRTSDLVAYCLSARIKDMVIGDNWFTRVPSTP